MTSGLRVDVYHHSAALEADVLELRSAVDSLREVLMTTQAELAQQLLQVRDQVTKVGAEVNAKIQSLEDAITSAGLVTPEVEAALQAVRDALQPIDDLTPDAP